MAVKVAPMLAPSVNGYSLSMLTTPIPQSGVSADVNILDDCMSIVKRAPINMAR